MAEPASIRYKNPGAMWGSALAIKWGAQKKAVALKDGTGQNNNIAVFPTYVQGICAQLDLWRTSKHYKNKRFADAIAIWSGGNHVESYIKFVCDRVPDMTRNTIMDDAFWRSPMGIAFLKAQAWHEAGKRYPAPAADWVEAQRLVFSGVAKPKAKPAPKPVVQVEAPIAAPIPPPVPSVPVPADQVQGDPEVWHVQRRLKAMNYSPGGIDGIWGGMTGGAVSGFLNDRRLMSIPAPTSVEMFREIAKELEAEISKAEAENPSWTRPIAVERKEATEATVAKSAPEIVPIARNRLAALWTAISGVFLAVVNGIADYFKDAVQWLSGFKEFFADVPGWTWLVVAAGVAGFFWFNSKQGADGISDAVKKGERL